MSTMTDVDQALEEAVNEAVECWVAECRDIAHWIITTNLCPCTPLYCHAHQATFGDAMKATMRRCPRIMCRECGAAVSSAAFTYRFNPI